MDFQPLHIQTRHRPAVNHLTAAQYAFERVASQELLTRKRKVGAVLTVIYERDLRSMAGSLRLYWTATPAARSGYI